MLQILIWGIGMLLIGLGFMLLYMTQAFPVREVVTKYRCEHCGQVQKENANKCECGGFFLPFTEAQILRSQPGIYRYISYAIIAAGPIFIMMGNSQAAALSKIPMKF